MKIKTLKVKIKKCKAQCVSKQAVPRFFTNSKMVINYRADAQRMMKRFIEGIENNVNCY